MRSDKGFVLVTVLLISVVLVLLVFGASVTSLLDRQSAANQRGGTQSYYVAKAGIEHFKTVVLNSLANPDEFSSGTTEEEPAACELPIVDRILFADGLSLQAGADADGNPYTLRVFLEQGSDEYYDLSYDVVGPIIYLKSVGYTPSSQSTVQLVATVGAGPTGTWDNAIYTEQLTPGAAAGLAGIIAVHGSMHIVEGSATVDEENDDVEFTGNAGIFNNYTGKGGNSATNLQAEANSVFSDPAMQYEDLCTRVKIYNGNLEVGRVNSAAGTRVGASGDTQGISNAIYGIYLDDDSSVSSKGDPIDPVAEEDVHVRNPVGDYGPYAENALPELWAPYPPTQVVGDDEANPMTVRTISSAATCPWIDASGIRPVLTLPPSDPTVDSTCSAADGNPALVWNGASQTLSVSGTGPSILSFPDLDFKITSNVAYSGEASFLFGRDEDAASGTTAFVSDITVNGQFKPAGTDYLTGSAIGLTTNGNVTLDVSSGSADAGLSKPIVASMVFAQGTIAVEKQIAVFGAVVGGEVTTKAVPSVAWNSEVPVVAAKLGLPGTNGPSVLGTFVDLSEERR